MTLLKTSDEVIQHNVQWAIRLHLLKTENLCKECGASREKNITKWYNKYYYYHIPKLEEMSHFFLSLKSQYLRDLFPRLDQEVHCFSSSADGLHCLFMAGISQVYTTHLG